MLRYCLSKIILLDGWQFGRTISAFCKILQTVQNCSGFLIFTFKIASYQQWLLKVRPRPTAIFEDFLMM